jgi:outer membrane protein OmpA-like peptidoglycan-associated protein
LFQVINFSLQNEETQDFLYLHLTKTPIMKRLFPLIFILAYFAESVKAQDFLGYFNSNYSGIFGVHLNPASIADNRNKFDATFMGASLGFQNNYIGMKRDAIKPQGSYFKFTEDNYPAFNDKDFQNKYLTERLNGKSKSVFLYNNIYLPSFMFTLKDRSAIGFSWRLRTFVNVDGISEPLAKQIYRELKDSSQYYNKLSNKNLSVQYMSWAEYNGTYAWIIKEEGPQFMKVGGTLKVLQGIGSAYVFSKNFEYAFNHEDTMAIFNTDVQFGHSTNFEFSEDRLQYRYTSNISFGADLGFIYEFRPDHDKFRYEMDGEKDLDMKWRNKYKYRIGISILDIGGMKFNKGHNSRDFRANVNSWYLDTLEFKNNPVGSFDDTLANRFEMNRSDGSYYMNTPTTIVANLDYNIFKDFFVNGMVFYAFPFTNNPHKVHDITTFSITPRWDWKYFGVYVPFSYNSYKNFNTGLDLRMGPLIIGTNSLNNFLSKKDLYGADIHFLLKIPILHKKPRDKDNDKVSDKLDKCKDVPGVWEFAGCPDRDGDHIEDKFDACPDDPGLKEFNGCPDRDGDKIIDKEDACPDEPGLVEFKGCPDKDGDGIIDKEDDCPDEPGVAYFRGCPDTDGDSIMDKHDRCPTIAGPLANQGCPYDRLYLIDQNGKELGVATRNSEGNFIFPQLPPDEISVFRLETYNEPPEITEVRVGVGTIVRIAKKGKDNLFRFEILKSDPNKLKKIEEEDRVIKLTKEEEEVLKKAFDNLEFESGKDIIKPSSYIPLNELAELMKKKPEWKLKLSGHTDNVGNPAKNMDLSKRRATAVKVYLKAQGIKDDRFIVKWYGITRPIADNKTPEGRQRNRRVEMLIIE